MEEELELTILMPCLNEAETIEVCVKKAMQSIKENGIKGEVLVADNGSTDDSYDFSNIMLYVEKLREGYELVVGNRYKGGIEKERCLGLINI